MKTIPLSKGYEAIVDDEDYEWLNQWKWYALVTGNTVYAVRSYKEDGKKITILMHRLITDAPDGMVVDHINHNGRDNRRTNLRVVTGRENNLNSRLRKDNPTGYRGVRQWMNRPRWNARIRVDGRDIHLGYHATPEDAARAYDQAAKKYFGEFAQLNFN